MSKYFSAAAVSLGAALFTAALPAQQIYLSPETASMDAVDATVPVPKKPVSLDVNAIDKTVDPCNDFYAYACGNWQKSHSIPADQSSWSRFQELDEYNVYSLYQLLEQAANHPTTPLQTKYGNYYAACVNEDLSNSLGAKPIQPALNLLAAWKDKETLASFVGQMEAQHGYGFFYGFGAEEDQKNSTVRIATLNQGGLTLPDRDYYLQDDDRMKKIRAGYVDHVTKMFVLLGDTPEQAATEAKAVLAIETALAKGSLPRVDLRDPDNVYHVKTPAELQALRPQYKWADYFSAIRVSAPKLNVAMPGFFQALNGVVQTSSIDDLRSYMRWQVLHANGNRLSKPFETESLHLISLLTGQEKQEPRWKRCTRSTDRVLGEAVGQDWTAKYFPDSSKAKANAMIHQLEVALGQDLNSLDWMSPATKVEAQKKLAAFRQKIGFPEKWRDYSKLQIKRDDRVGNAERDTVFEDKRNLDKIGKPVDETEWDMSPPTVNAYYNPAQNDINFPAGILQPPFFDAGTDPAVNFGGIGVVIGHEMTHGFDDEGAKYDATGNVRDWWTKDDKSKFDARTSCEVKQYGAFDSVEGEKLNGKLTLGENTADNGGMRIAYAALQSELGKQAQTDASKKIDGFSTDQRFFLGFAQVWCENTRPEFARMMVKVDPHSPGRFRTNGVVQNFEKFGEAFSCKKGSPMYPADSCRVW